MGLGLELALTLTGRISALRLRSAFLIGPVRWARLELGFGFRVGFGLGLGLGLGLSLGTG